MVKITNINKHSHSSTLDDDDDCTVFQTDEDRNILEREILDDEVDATEDMEVTPEKPKKSIFRPYW